MKNFFLFICAVSLITSCGSIKKLEVTNIQNVYLEYNHIEDRNYGTSFEGKIIALLNDGEEIDITNNRNLTFNSTDIQSQSNKNFKIVKHPTSFDDNYLRVSYTISEKDKMVTFFDSVLLNLRGKLIIDSKGLAGANGITQKNRGSSIIFRDGKDGEHGTAGSNGTSAGNYVVYIWKEKDVYRIYMQDIASKIEWKYSSIQPESILFDLSGGDGGNGGDGGDGGNGKDGIIEGDKSKTPGNGGDAGFGGTGGTGGDAGSIVIFLHSNAAEIKQNIGFNLSGGKGGQGGAKGKPGQPGSPVAGQTASYTGKIARDGRPGVSGQDGQIPEIAIQSFDYNGYK